jgi:hypothetical protein
MNQEDKTNVTVDTQEKLVNLGYDSFKKRILNHHDMALPTCKFTIWASPEIRSLVNSRTSEGLRSGKIDYKQNGPTEPLLRKEYETEKVTVDEFVDVVRNGVLQIKLKFTSLNQSLVHYNETLSRRSIYSWGNNVSISHLTDDYEAQGLESWKCSINKYGINTKLWYPVNIVTNAPWYNHMQEQESVFPLNYICLGIDQAQAARSAGMRLMPQIDDITCVSTSPAAVLNSDLKPHAEEYNDTVINDEYEFESEDDSGWLFVAIKGYVFTHSVEIMITDKYQKTRVFSFV